MEEQRWGHKKKKEFLTRSWKEKQRKGIKGVEWLTDEEDGSIGDGEKGEDMMLRKSPVAD